MKKLICLFLATVSIAYADVVAKTKNDAGGLIVVSDVPCTKQRGFIAYTSGSSSNTIFGCWFSDSEMIHITWSTGDVRSYGFDGWEINVDVAKKLKPSKSL